jgi:hypothetical protein
MIFGTLIVLGGASAALATDPIRYVSDHRRCTAAFGGNGAGSTWQDRPVAFGDYQGGVTLQPSNGLETWLGESDQVSWMNGMAMAMTSTAQSSVTGTPTSHVFAQGQSNFDVWFAADDTIYYILSGTLDEAGNSLSAVTITLSDVDGAVIETATSAPDVPTTMDRNGQLAPGTYHMLATIYARAEIPPGVVSGGTARCSMYFSVVLPGGCEADWNHDGLIDTFDFFAFTDDFLGGSADFNHSGGTDSADFYDFMTAFFAGCH